MRAILLGLTMMQGAVPPIGYVPVKPKNLWKATKISTATVLVTCPSGEKPSVNEAKGMSEANWVLVTCNR